MNRTSYAVAKVVGTSNIVALGVGKNVVEANQKLIAVMMVVNMILLKQREAA